jgi:hypothetical protein
MRIVRVLLAMVAMAAVFGCEGLPQPKELDQGKVDRTMDQVENGKG